MAAFTLYVLITILLFTNEFLPIHIQSSFKPHAGRYITLSMVWLLGALRKIKKNQRIQTKAS